MPQERQVKILVADDDPDILHMLKDTLENAGFSVETATDGDEALRKIKSKPPDIAVLDRQMPGRDGFSVCRELRRDSLYQYLPLIILSAQAGRESKIEGLELGADDFIAKPVDTPELLARIRMILRRTREGLDANPLSRLPGNVSIETHIQEAISQDRPFAVLYLDLNQFKAYNDVYGYEAGDRVIKATALLLIRSTNKDQKADDFVGHIGGDDFIVLTTPERMESMARRITAEFDAMAPGFYNEEDRKRGTILAADRQGRRQEFPLLSIAIGICHNTLRRLISPAQISQLGAELKSHAKAKSGSAYIIDRRRE